MKRIELAEEEVKYLGEFTKKGGCPTIIPQQIIILAHI
jgi:hypothetical protein